MTILSFEGGGAMGIAFPMNRGTVLYEPNWGRMIDNSA